MTYEIVAAVSDSDVDQVRELFVEYARWLGDAVCSSRLAEEIAALPGPYAAPRGTLLLARSSSGDAAGVVGLRPFEPGVCEIKRLYVRPAHRGEGLGRRLAESAVSAAEATGYERILLTTFPDAMERALGIYRDLGFDATEPFVDHSHVGSGVEILFMERSTRSDMRS